MEKYGWVAVPIDLLLAIFIVTGILNFVSGGGYVLKGLHYYQDFDAGVLPHQNDDSSES